MCGRFALFASSERIAALFDLGDVPGQSPRYNIAPIQVVAAVRREPNSGRRVLTRLRWGLIPSWAKDPAIGSRMINARSETVAEKPSFRQAFRARRCLVVADGFYEWQKVEGGKQPYFIALASREPFAIAGLWEQWQPADAPAIETCTLLTTEANDLMRPLHDRMPVILSPMNYDLWLDPDVREKELLLSLLRPYSAEEMMAYPVSSLVNNPKHDSPRCIEPEGENS